MAPLIILPPQEIAFSKLRIPLGLLVLPFELLIGLIYNLCARLIRPNNNNIY